MTQQASNFFSFRFWKNLERTESLTVRKATPSAIFLSSPLSRVPLIVEQVAPGTARLLVAKRQVSFPLENSWAKIA
ncbi:MAG: hypothetical protein J6W63_07505, partial [Treponema sp.]|nr:hypothetical protein [Treponema sp.]